MKYFLSFCLGLLLANCASAKVMQLSSDKYSVSQDVEFSITNAKEKALSEAKLYCESKNLELEVLSEAFDADIDVSAVSYTFTCKESK